MRAVASADPVASSLPSPDQATAVTDSPCSTRLNIMSPLRESLTSKLLWIDPVASARPSPEIARQETHASSVLFQLSTCPLSSSQRVTVFSTEPAATRRSFGNGLSVDTTPDSNRARREGFSWTRSHQRIALSKELEISCPESGANATE